MQATAGTRYITLDHWRGLAALSVALFHTITPWLNGPRPAGMDWLVVLGGQGWKGVHLFFVISGYCIGLLALREIRARRLPGLFLANRFLRIFPPYWAACAVAAAAAVAALPFTHTALFEHAPVFGALPGTVGSLLRHVFLLDPLLAGTGGYLLVAWTLSWEISFYLMAAGVILVAVTTSVRLAMALALALAIAGACSGIIPLWPVLRGWAEFTCGGCVLAAETSRREGRPAWPWLAFIAALGGIGCIAPDATRMLPFAAAFALGLYALQPHDSWLANLRGGRWLGSLGVMSYSLYLIHAPIISPVRNLLSRLIPASSPWFIVPLLAAFASGIAGACLFERWFEAPFERWRKSRSWLRLSPSAA